MSDANHQVDVTEHLFIPLSDGTRLAARIWMPAGASRNPVPAILEYIPYGKRDGTRARDEPMHHWFASNGYAAIRVDLRGSGESDGFLADEYLGQELNDGVEIIAWIARQSWCTGHVGLMGKSWGGFNALQIAALRPAALKAIITVCSTDDRYADDIHYIGGCLLNDNLWWGSIMLAYQARPADAALIGDSWRPQWLERIANMPFWPALWLRQQRRSNYWRHGSVCQEFSAIEIPVFAVGGWMDAYSNAIPRLLAGLQVPRLGLIGPWAHNYPHDGRPGPAIGFLQEALRWWDHWLKSRDTGIMGEPMLRAYVEEWSTPRTWRDPAPGRWVAEPTWPSPRVTPRPYRISADGLRTTPAMRAELTLCSAQWTGTACGEWMGTGVPGEMPADQRMDDGMSLSFDSKPLGARVEILGAPEIDLNVMSDRPVAHLCARLCDVAPDGSSRRISYGVLNLTHHASHSEPRVLEAGQFNRVRLKLNDCGYAFPAGHRIRLALSTSYWPLIWPAPSAVTLTISTEDAMLVLPVRPPRAEDGLVSFKIPSRDRAAPTTIISPGRFDREVKFDLVTGIATYVTVGEGGLFGEGAFRYDELGTTINHCLRRELTIDSEDPLSARYCLVQTYDLNRNGKSFRIETKTEMKSTKKEFHLEGTLDAFEDGILASGKAWREVIARDFL
jgi:putative CocE/NonD family hydrolase